MAQLVAGLLSRRPVFRSQVTQCEFSGAATGFPVGNSVFPCQYRLRVHPAGTDEAFLVRKSAASSG